MVEQERLELTAAVEPDFEEPLNRLESALEDVDDAIRDTGKGRDYVDIDVETSGVEKAWSEIKALDGALSGLTDDVTIDVETNFDDVLRDDVGINSDLRGSQFINTNTGRATAADDALDRKFSDVSEAIDELLNDVGNIDVTADTDSVGDEGSDDNRIFSPEDESTLDKLSDLELASVLDAETGFSTHVPTNDVTPDSPDSPGGDGSGGEAVTGGGTSNRMFTRDNMDEWLPQIEPYFDQEAFIKKGGETDRLSELLTLDLEDAFTFDLIDKEGSGVSIEDAAKLSEPDMDAAMDGIDAFDNAESKMGSGTLLGSGGGTQKELSRLYTNFQRLRFTMAGFHKIMAAMLPLLGVFIGALPAAIAGLTALGVAAAGAAGAFGAIGALGALGMGSDMSMEAFKDRVSELKDSFLNAFAPLAESFAPTIRKAISQIEAMAGPLATASAGLLAFRDEFSGLISSLVSGIPSFTKKALAFTDTVMPVFKGIASFISNTDFLGALASQLNQALPALELIGGALVDIIPAVLQLSQGFLFLAGGLVFALGVLSKIINVIPFAGRFIGVLISGILLVTTATTLWSIASLAAAKTLMGPLVQSVAKAITALTGYTISTFAAWVATVALITAITFGLAAITSLGAGFGALSGKVKSARKQLEKFNKTAGVSNGAPSFGGGINSTGSGGSYFQDNSTTVIYANDRDDAARQTYSSQYEHDQHVDSVFGG